MASGLPVAVLFATAIIVELVHLGTNPLHKAGRKKVHEAVLILGAAVVVFMVLFPPYVMRRKGQVASHNYSFICTPPRRFGRRCVVNVPALMSQLFACGVVFSLLEVFCE